MSCHQCSLMSEYYAAREAQEQRAENYSAGYDTEYDEFYETVEARITFKDWIVGRKRERAEV